MSNKVLIVLHQETSTPGRVGMQLIERGFSLDIRRPRFGDPLPGHLDDFEGAIVFGGPMSANDSDAFVQREIDWLGMAMQTGRPVFGICLGAQMMVKALGGTVRAHKDALVEVGYYPVEATTAGQNLMTWPSKFYQWHREGMYLPDNTDAELLVSGKTYPCQAFRVGKAAYGIQFHPELTLAMMYRWTTKAAPRMKLPGAKSRSDHFRGRALFDPAVKTWLSDFLDLWIGRANQN